MILGVRPATGTRAKPAPRPAPRGGASGPGLPTHANHTAQCPPDTALGRHDCSSQEPRPPQCSDSRTAGQHWTRQQLLTPGLRFRAPTCLRLRSFLPAAVHKAVQSPALPASHRGHDRYLSCPRVCAFTPLVNTH